MGPKKPTDGDCVVDANLFVNVLGTAQPEDTRRVSLNHGSVIMCVELNWVQTFGDCIIEHPIGLVWR